VLDVYNNNSRIYFGIFLQAIAFIDVIIALFFNNHINMLVFSQNLLQITAFTTFSKKKDENILNHAVL